ncbi:hypothetical protein KOR42_03560 [Thalassoglobus neptunius]|uniref:Uncharacterized protein n=1 Tax=Thalassoglobus neptunius TaxID=1938619 RepID=A0A5C5X309_9PLAN|nr:hypothetical protein [Thalassoglobus neptunius]TWT56999.1 hypothetical protein KOR42_03560 [Thalassoglobus neptunius]
MGRKLVGILGGLIVGFAWNMALVILSSFLFPLPPGVDLNDADAFAAYVETLPPTAFLIVLLAHAGGAFVGGYICELIVAQNWLAGPICIGTLTLLGGITNLMMISHPIWFAIADVILYLPAAIFGAIVASRTRGRKPEMPETQMTEPNS